MTTHNHSSRCILRSLCRQAGTSTCNPLCQSYISVHGHDGKGGRVSAAGVPADYRYVTPDTSPVREAQPAAYRLIDAYTETFGRMFDGEAAERIKSLYLFSESPGTGKTTTAAALINEWITVHYIGSIRRNRQAADRPAIFFDVNEFQTLYNGFNRPRIPDRIAEPFAEKYYSTMMDVMRAPFAVLDDIGVRDCTDGFRADLHTIINERTANGMPTVYTSNVPIADLADLYDARLADRVGDQCKEIYFVGTSKRGMRK